MDCHPEIIEKSYDLYVSAVQFTVIFGSLPITYESADHESSTVLNVI